MPIYENSSLQYTWEDRKLHKEQSYLPKKIDKTCLVFPYHSPKKEDSLTHRILRDFEFEEGSSILNKELCLYLKKFKEKFQEFYTLNDLKKNFNKLLTILK